MLLVPRWLPEHQVPALDICRLSCGLSGPVSAERRQDGEQGGPSKPVVPAAESSGREDLLVGMKSGWCWGTERSARGFSFMRCFLW